MTPGMEKGIVAMSEEKKDADVKKEKPKLPIPPIWIPRQSSLQDSLLLRHHERSLQLDRERAKSIYNNKDTKVFQGDGSYYRLPALAEKFKSSTYRKNVNNNFCVHYYKWNDELLFKYKTLFRADRIHSIDAFNSQMHYVKRRDFSKVLSRMSAVDWCSIIQLCAKYRKNRRVMIRPDLVLGRQPLNVLCEPLVLHRVEFVMPFRTERFLSPMTIVLNWNDIRSSLSNRLLNMQREERRGKLHLDVTNFRNQNQGYWAARKKKSKPFMLPLGHMDTLSLWDRKYMRKENRRVPIPKKRTLRKFVLGKLASHHLFDELNQLPADFPTRFYAFRALRPLHLRIIKYAPTKREEQIPDPLNWVQMSYPNVHVQQFEEHDLEELAFDNDEVTCRYLTIEPSIHSYGPDPAVTFIRKIDPRIKGRSLGELHAQIYYPDEDDCASLGTVSGFSTESFATTMTETPLDHTYSWKLTPHMEMGATCYSEENYTQNIKRWKHFAATDLGTRLAGEIQERLVKCCMSDSNKLCRNTKNEYFRDLLVKDSPLKFVFFEHDHMHCTERLNALLEEMNSGNGKRPPLKKRKATLLWETAERLLHLYPTRKFDRYRGLDVNPSWAIVVFQELVPEIIIDRLVNLFGSHDVWIDTSSVRYESCHSPLYIQRILGKGERRPWAHELAMNVIMFIFLVIAFIFLAILAPFAP